MTMRAQIQWLPDRRRLHMNDGPIDLIVLAEGPPRNVELAYRAAAERFPAVLDELCSELLVLRQPVCEGSPMPSGRIARRMYASVMPYGSETFITPMAAVAGAVAEEILDAMTSAARLARAYVNDGGDIALHLGEGEEFVIGLVEHSEIASMFGNARVAAHLPIRGIATSGWRGRSFSLGIADAVTVLAATASMADAAATIVANAVNLRCNSKIVRVPACELVPDSDLGDLLVTQSVAELAPEEVECALDSGAHMARNLQRKSLIAAAALRLQGETRVVSACNLIKRHEVSKGSIIHA